MEVILKVVINTYDGTPISEVIDDVVTLLEDDFPEVQVTVLKEVKSGE